MENLDDTIICNAVHFDSEQEYVDYMFIWLIYANYGSFLGMEELAIAA